MGTPVAYYDAAGNARDANGAVMLWINAPVGDVVGVMDGYEDDIEAIYIKGNPIPQWDPLATKNNLAGFGFPGIGALSLPDLSKLWEDYWFLILALGILSAALLIRGM